MPKPHVHTREHSFTLQEHSFTLREHSSTLQEHPSTLQEHSFTTQEHSFTIQEHSFTTQEHSFILQEHSFTLLSFRPCPWPISLGCCPGKRGKGFLGRHAARVWPYLKGTPPIPSFWGSHWMGGGTRADRPLWPRVALGTTRPVTLRPKQVGRVGVRDGRV